MPYPLMNCPYVTAVFDQVRSERQEHSVGFARSAMLLGCPPGPVHALPQIALDSALRVTYARRAHHYGDSPCYELLARCSAGLNGEAPAFG
jgi:hypothetical protein